MMEVNAVNGYSIIDQIVAFISELGKSLSDGNLFFGSTIDLVRYIADIAIVSLIFYWVLLFVKQSRAWQLIKGIILIYCFVLICGLFGLNMVGYLFNKFLYVFAILFIVLFQPELRRALETVGLRSFGSISHIFSSDEMTDKEKVNQLVTEISSACMNMARTYTGALILIERTTRLDELLQQENVVKFDSTVSSSVLQSIFYKGSPMHDGGLLIRNGRIVAARCHVPLSVTMHSLDRAGTRHRAAVGASEMGDTIAVCVSEERGKTSIAVNGRLYEMKNSNELEVNLRHLLGIVEEEEQKKGISKFFKKIKPYKAAKAPIVKSEPVVPATESAGEKSIPIEFTHNEEDSAKKAGFGSKVIVMFFAILLSVFLWTYIQVTTNPVVTTTVTVPISYNEDSTPDNMQVSYPIDTVEVEIVGRQNTIDAITRDDVVAYIDYSSVSSAGVVELPIDVSAADRSTYFRVERQIPETISVTVYAADTDN